MATTTINGERLVSLIEDAGPNGETYEPRSYSGRAMFGERCVGVTIESRDVLALGSRLARSAVDAIDADDFEDVKTYSDAVTSAVKDVARLMAHAREDNMGLQQIVYWPDVAWPEGREDGDEDDD